MIFGSLGSVPLGGVPSRRFVVFVYPSGIATADQFGVLNVGYIAQPSGIASQESVNLLELALVVTMSNGIASAEIVTSPEMVAALVAVSIQSGETLGNTTVQLTITGSGIASAEVVSNPFIDFYSIIVGAGNISSAEAFGVAKAILALLPLAVASAEASGHPAAGGAYASIAVAYSANIVRLEETENTATVGYGVGASVMLSSSQVNAADVGYSVIIVREEIRQ